MKRTYNRTYYPPAPTLQVRVAIADTGLSSESVSGIVDTGADATIVPIQYLDQIEAAVEGFGTVRGHWGDSTSINLHAVDVVVEEIVFPGILVVGDEEGDEVILGRDVLNRMRLLLDGLKLQSEVVGY
jgi:predicted aspartyl protease